MKRRELTLAIAIALCGNAIACVGADPSGAPGVDPDATDAPLERRRLDKDFPYRLDDGASLVCGEWEVVSSEGTVVDLEREWYPIEVMNRQLGGTDAAADEIEAISDSHRQALRELGIDRVSTCDDARSFVRVVEKLDADGPVEEIELPEIDDLDSVPEPDLDPAPGDEVVDKIIRGVGFDHASTVGISIDGGGCTGNLIGPFALMTAAHCIPSTGFVKAKVWIQTPGSSQTCIWPNQGGDCPSVSSVNAYAQRHPSYNGSAAYDQAVVIVNPGWKSPANSSSRWTRFAANWGLPFHVAWNSIPVRIAGYGANVTAGFGFGLGRRGEDDHFITSMNGAGTTFGIPRVSTSASGTCNGDSGSGPYNNTTLLSNNLNMMMGTLRGGSPTTGVCTAVNGVMNYSIPDGPWVSNLVEFFGGTCTNYTHSASGTPYVRCW